MSYVIMILQTSDATVQYEEDIIQSVALTGSEFNIDTITLHYLVLYNVHVYYDAYNYIKKLFRYSNESRDILVLQDG